MHGLIVSDTFYTSSISALCEVVCKKPEERMAVSLTKKLRKRRISVRSELNGNLQPRNFSLRYELVCCFHSKFLSFLYVIESFADEK